MEQKPLLTKRVGVKYIKHNIFMPNSCVWPFGRLVMYKDRLSVSSPYKSMELKYKNIKSAYLKILVTKNIEKFVVIDYKGKNKEELWLTGFISTLIYNAMKETVKKHKLHLKLK